MNGIQHTGSSRPGPAATSGGAGGAAAASPAASRGAELRHMIEQRVVPHLLGLHGAQPPDGAFITGTPEFSARLSVELAVDAVGANPERVRARLELSLIHI